MRSWCLVECYANCSDQNLCCLLKLRNWFSLYFNTEQCVREFQPWMTFNFINRLVYLSLTHSCSSPFLGIMSLHSHSVPLHEYSPLPVCCISLPCLATLNIFQHFSTANNSNILKFQPHSEQPHLAVLLSSHRDKRRLLIGSSRLYKNEV